MPPQQSTAPLPQLVVLAPDAYRGRRIPLHAERTVVGRGPTCDVRFDDPYVSKTHALLQRHGDAVYVSDLKSLGGTWVNGAAAGTARQVRPGDLVALADVLLWLDPAGADQTSAPRQDAGPQVGGIINNILGTQYNAYVQRRESFLREVSATRTKARWLVWLGLLCYLVGFGMFLAAIVGFIGQVIDAIESNDPRPPVDLLGPDLGGVPSGLFGFGLAGVGTVLLVFGIVLHIVATSRRQRAERELPVPPPWAVPGQLRSDLPMSQNIYGQQAGVANNVVGTLYSYGGQQGTVVTTGEVLGAATQLRAALAALPLEATAAAEARSRVDEIDAALTAAQPDPARVGNSLDRLERLLTKAGLVATAGARLTGPLQTLARWVANLAG